MIIDEFKVKTNIPSANGRTSLLEAWAWRENFTGAILQPSKKVRAKAYTIMLSLR